MEHLTDSQEYTPEERCELKRRQSTTLLNPFEKWMESTYIKVSPPKQVGPSHLLCVSIMAQNENLS